MSKSSKIPNSLYLDGGGWRGLGINVQTFDVEYKSALNPKFLLNSGWVRKTLGIIALTFNGESKSAKIQNALCPIARGGGESMLQYLMHAEPQSAKIPNSLCPVGEG